MISTRKYYKSERKSILIIIFIKLIDFWVDLYCFFCKKKSKCTNSKNVLIASFGHLGDALMVSYIFPEIKKKYPDAKIDLLIGEWCKPIFENNPYVNDLIIINHFFTNRSKVGILKKIIINLQTAISAYQKLKYREYVYSIDVRYTTATSHFFTYFLNIDKRIGFNSAGFGGLLDVEVPLPDLNLHLLEIVGQLLKEAGVEYSLSEIKPYFNIQTSVLSTQSKIPTLNLHEDFITIFPETGEPLRHISLNYWANIIKNVLTILTK